MQRDEKLRLLRVMLISAVVTFATLTLIALVLTSSQPWGRALLGLSWK